MNNPSAVLKRTLNLPLLTLYGLGTILGAGIYVLIGAVAGRAGMFAPLSFLLAAVCAGFTAFSYAELASRMPRSAGEAVYLKAAFGRRQLTALVGWVVIGIGMVSAATIANGFAGYAGYFVDLPKPVSIVIFLLCLGALAIKGIAESVWVAAVLTAVEIIGLLLVVFSVGDQLLTLPSRWPELVPGIEWPIWGGIFAGAYLAFYAFIGFEDMVNVAEEVRAPERTLPWSIIISLVLATLLYGLVALVSVLSVSPEVLANSSAPLSTVAESGGRVSPALIGLISLMAVTNGALVQIIMASRVIYGLTREGAMPQWLGQIHPGTQTPLRATALVTFIVMGLALWFPLITLAEATSSLTLIVFTAVNVGLWAIQRQHPAADGVYQVGPWVPVCGALCSMIFLGLNWLL